MILGTVIDILTVFYHTKNLAEFQIQTGVLPWTRKTIKELPLIDGKPDLFPVLRSMVDIQLGLFLQKKGRATL